MIARESTVFVGRKRRDEGREEKHVLGHLFLGHFFSFLSNRLR